MSLRVSTDGTAGPYIIVPVGRLDEVCAVLNRRRIPYSVDFDAISQGGMTVESVINLGKQGDSETVQSLLDQAFSTTMRRRKAPKKAKKKQAKSKLAKKSRGTK